MKVGEARDVSCAEGKRALTTIPGAVVVSAPGGCGVLSTHSEYVSAIVPTYKWPKVWQPLNVEGRMYMAAYEPPASPAPGSIP